MKIEIYYNFFGFSYFKNIAITVSLDIFVKINFLKSWDEMTEWTSSFTECQRFWLITTKTLICFILVIENVFDPTDFDQDASLILECSSRLREQCNKFGNVKKVVVYDKHIQGICQVFFSTPEEADMGKKQSFFKKNLFPLPRHLWMALLDNFTNILYF